MNKKHMILIISAVFMILVLSLSAVFADSSKEPDLTDVTGIRYEPTASVMLDEWIDGFLDEDSCAFYYSYGKVMYQDGSTLILVNKDGTESRFVLNNKKKAYIGEDGTVIKKDKLYIQSTDYNYNAEWKIGKKTFNGWGPGEHSVTVKYGDFTYDVTVTVVENSIDNIEYIQHDPIAENCGGYWTTDTEENKYYYYNNYSYRDQDVVRVTMKDGTVKQYTHKDSDEEEDDDLGTQYIFRAKDGTSIALWYYQITDDQPDHHWTVGSDNFCVFYYGGKECQSQVTIKLKNTLKASGKTATVKYAKLKKKTQKISKAKAFKINNAKGSVTFQMAKKDKKAGNKITVSKKGVVTVKKGLKKGKYTIKVNVKAAGDDTYAPMTKVVAVKVNVK